MSKTCGAMFVLWPDVETIERYCDLPVGHAGRHHSPPPAAGSWDDDEADSWEWDR